MRAGNLRHRITLQKQIDELNDFGAFEKRWKSIATVWAEILPINGREYFSAAQVQSEVTTQINLRFLTGITPTMRVLFGKRQFEIVSVINLAGREIQLQLMCKEIING